VEGRFAARAPDQPGEQYEDTYHETLHGDRADTAEAKRGGRKRAA
jgi:hypothetical protein